MDYLPDDGVCVLNFQCKWVGNEQIERYVPPPFTSSKYPSHIFKLFCLRIFALVNIDLISISIYYPWFRRGVIKHSRDQ